MRRRLDVLLTISEFLHASGDAGTNIAAAGCFWMRSLTADADFAEEVPRWAEKLLVQPLRELLWVRRTYWLQVILCPNVNEKWDVTKRMMPTSLALVHNAGVPGTNIYRNNTNSISSYILTCYYKIITKEQLQHKRAAVWLKSQT